MAVIMSQNTRNSTAAIRYVLDEKEGQAKGERYVVASGIGVHPRAAVSEFARVRKAHGKEKGFIQGYCLVQSFDHAELDPANPVDWEKANELGRAVAADRFPGHQVIVVTQRDGDGTTGGRNGRGGALHNHIIVNAVHTETGRSIRGSVVTHKRLAKEHDRILEAHRYGWKNTVELKDHQADRRTKAEAYYPAKIEAWEAAQAAGDTTKKKPVKPDELTLKTLIRQALEDERVDGFDKFAEVCRELGADAQQRGGKGRGITYALLDDNGEPVKKTARRATSLGLDFTMDAVDAAAERNRAAQLAKAQEKATAPARPAPATVRPVRVPATDWRAAILGQLAPIIKAALFTDMAGFQRAALKAGVQLVRQRGNPENGYTMDGADRVYLATELGEEYTHNAVADLAERSATLRAAADENAQDLPLDEVIEALEADETQQVRRRRQKAKDTPELPPARARYLERQRSYSRGG